MTTLTRLLGSSALLASTLLASQVLSAEPITILINTSPWYGGFEALVEKYEADTGNKVNIDAVPLGGLLEKARNAVRGPSGEYDIINLSNAWAVEFYAGNYLTALTDIDPTFSFGDNIIDADGMLYWNKDRQWPMKDGGVPMAFSPNANTHLWYYRTDQIEKPPETWDDVLKTCQTKGDAANYSVVLRGARGNPIRFAFSTFMLSFGGSIEKDAPNGDFTVTFNSPEVKRALQLYIKLAKECGPPNPGSIDQGEMIQYIVAGKVKQAGIVVAAQAQMDDPEKSAVVGKIGYAVMPRPADGENKDVWGSWEMGIPANVSAGRKEAAMEFIKYFLTDEAQTYYAEAGGIPVSRTVLEGPLSQQEKFRWMKPYSQASLNAKQVLQYPEGAEIEQIIGLRLNQALIGELSVNEALNTAATEIHDVFVRSGRKTGLLPPLQ
ncbi:extracellular solute-binding protein [Mesorhizobium sp. WSM4307]|uniref:extracellular solute-binding protein n=1 Tax=unclassified Mesorhizobium TaxID=325217 RepID=UPI000BAF9CDE|nr:MULTISPECIES: extracellular solute-binding protein [unclassified Mesorhizobium]PBB24483.1 ABC transporter substrate-binding protein [Mesorhizobium sp. WSM4304]PBB74548.1 ABC transporter substrate-binding protein [Mesorhizobium sp. WSM4308]TRC73289.1 extracellular solute-binding protein [Mesorhizobium sp. WSM4315]TRC83568.1 extracellular solute-binding protein [Mesorhizobium sp. WSM4307]